MSAGFAVIGGGISGLASAYRIAGLGRRVTLFESGPDLGGLASTFSRDGVDLERFYHCLLPGDDALIGLIRELGLERDLFWKRTKMGFTYRRVLYPLNTALDLLRFDPLTFPERVRTGLLGIRGGRAGADERLDDVSAEDWIRDQVGVRALDVLWKPLLSAKIGDRYVSLPALWLTSRMAREKSTGPETKGCLLGGYRSLIDALSASLRGRGGSIRVGVQVKSIERDNGSMIVRFDDGSREFFDTVISTVPLRRFQQMTRDLPVDDRIANLDLDYQGVISGLFIMEKPLSDCYWMPFVGSGTVSQGCVEMSNLVPLDRTRGLHVVYLVNYTHRDSDLFSMSDRELLELYRGDLAMLFPGAVASIVDQYVFRAPYVEPVWSLGYKRKRPPSTVIPGRLYLSCTAQVYPMVNSWNSCCELVDGMLPSLAAETTATERSGSAVLA